MIGKGNAGSAFPFPVVGKDDNAGMARWMMYAKKADFKEIAKELHISPVTARIIRNRDVVGTQETDRFLNGKLSDLDDPCSIPGLNDAASLLLKKIREHRKIRVIGDYDVDGICSSYILWRLISFLGGDVTVSIPDRIKDGYGINEQLVKEAIEDGADTIITCDNGIAADRPLQLAKEAGLTVIVTDHHDIPYTEEVVQGQDHLAKPVRQYHYPPADVIAEPWIVDETTKKPIARFPHICGAMVVWKLAMILLGKPDLDAPKDEHEPEEVQVARELLGFASLATVCDVMPLVDENRILVRYGLKEASRTSNLGLQSLILASGLGGVELTVYHAGFVLGPCLNASGRLDSAKRSLCLFQEKNKTKAMTMARDLKQLNDSRKSMTEEEARKASDAIEQDARQGRDLLERKVLVVVLNDCHESVAGIIAGRIREKYHRPALVLTRAQETIPGEERKILLKGSGRSIESYNMFEELNRCRDLFLKFGGHAMAVGVTMEADHVSELDRRLNVNCTLKEEDLQEVLHIDMELPPSLVTKELLQEFALLEPCGTGNPHVLLAARNIRLKKVAVFGKKQNVIRFDGTERGTGNVKARDNEYSQPHFEFVWFIPEQELPEFLRDKEALCSVVYEPQLHIWKEKTTVQFVIRDVKEQKNPVR